jgi:hypothetical protein
MEMAIWKMTDGKATLMDEISIEIITNGETVGCQWLYRVLRNTVYGRKDNCWRTREKGLIIKKEPKQCKNNG